MSLLMQQAERPVENIIGLDKQPVAVSVVVPVVERCDDLAHIYRIHAQVLKRLGSSFEFVFVVDDGFEEAVQKLEPLTALGEPIQVAVLPRSFGEATALTVGFEQARGETLIVLPAYFQVVPEGITKVLEMLDEGYDLIVTRRFPRVDSWINRLQTYGFHFLTRRLTGVELHDISCGLKALSRRVVREVEIYGDLHRFFPLLAYQRGFRVVEVDIPQHPIDCQTRIYQPGVYLRRLLDILNLVFLYKFIKKPLRFFGLVGLGLFGGGFLISLVLAVQKIIGSTALADRPLLILGVLLMVLGVQVGSIGLLGEIIVFTHARTTRDYTVEKVVE